MANNGGQRELPQPRAVIVDTDPGIDDCLALCMLLNSPQDVNILGLTTVFGNGPIELMVRNAKYILEYLGKGQIPVYYGAAGPLELQPGEKARMADHVHGKDGLGDCPDIEMPSTTKKPIGEESASEFILKQARKFPSQLELITLGPLTNLALALRSDPDITTLIKQVVIMGGAFAVEGNVSPAAEANIFGDPLAADIVFSSGLNIKCIGLDVTNSIKADQYELDRLISASALSNSAKLCSRVVQFYQNFYRETLKTNAISLHDPAAVAYFLKPEYFEFMKTSVRVVRDGIGKGATIYNQKLKDWSGNSAWTASEVYIALNVPDVEKVVELCMESIIGKCALLEKEMHREQAQQAGHQTLKRTAAEAGTEASEAAAAAPLVRVEEDEEGGGGENGTGVRVPNDHTSGSKVEHQIENYGREIKRAKSNGKEYEMQKQRICIWCSRMTNTHRKTSWYCKACDKPYCRDGTNGRNCFSAHVRFGEPPIGAYKKGPPPKM